MVKRTVLVLVVAALCAPMLVTSAGATSARYRPDAVIKLCGQSEGCTINPPPHPWRGNDIYNTTARHQTIRQRLDNGEGVRFWILFQNDGTRKDTYSLHGCKGTKNFVINAVLVGKYKYPQGAGVTHITQEFIDNSWTFTLAPGKHIAITLNIVTVNAGFTYRCPVTITSQGNSTKKDTVAAVMTTF